MKFNTRNSLRHTVSNLGGEVVVVKVDSKTRHIVPGGRPGNNNDTAQHTKPRLWPAMNVDKGGARKYHEKTVS